MLRSAHQMGRTIQFLGKSMAGWKMMRVEASVNQEI
jgi:hypothetical protein